MTTHPVLREGGVCRIRLLFDIVLLLIHSSSLLPQEREARGAMGAPLGEARLFFGCRARGQDYIYADEIARWKDAGVLSKLDCAFSREQVWPASALPRGPFPVPPSASIIASSGLAMICAMRFW